MELEARQLHPFFVGEVDGGGLVVRDAVTREQIEAIRAGMDRYAVLVFRNQEITDEEQVAFAKRLDGELHAAAGQAALDRTAGKRRLPNSLVTDISNLDESSEIMESSDRRRMYALGNRLWHTDASFVAPAGRYSMLSAKTVPPVGGETEYVDERAAYDALSDEMKTEIEGLRAHHSIVYSRSTIGFTAFTPEEEASLPGADHPLVRTLPRSNRKTLYLASHASHILGWPVPEGRLLLRELLEHATQTRFVYRHRWQVGDFVIWDNRCTMHRGRPFDEKTYRRDLHRVTTLDYEPVLA
ncbi:MAG: TauD/TfdA family dioxygenase [Candidatus Eremiobacteraeota bacterium]|nr:TauD/TfdA family dioxygenase [Candidatus Eremiobacteraeota bacterium]